MVQEVCAAGPVEAEAFPAPAGGMACRTTQPIDNLDREAPASLRSAAAVASSALWCSR